jgi:hypothetical protein
MLNGCIQWDEVRTYHSECGMVTLLTSGECTACWQRVLAAERFLLNAPRREGKGTLRLGGVR